LVSERLQAKVRHDFCEAATAAIRRLDDLRLANADLQSLERIQAAVVVLSNGDLEQLEHYAALAETDWRDVLVFSGLGNADWPSRLDAELDG
jgi:hypothetical protein